MIVDYRLKNIRIQEVGNLVGVVVYGGEAIEDKSMWFGGLFESYIAFLSLVTYKKLKKSFGDLQN